MNRMKTAYFTFYILYTTVLCYDDQTRNSSSSGTDVVETVIELIKQSCIFPDDKLFLRRLAYVASKDGQDPTYRQNLDGGIWQINKSQFKKIARSTNAHYLFPSIYNHFGIHWASVEWSELKKPLFSGLAAALLISTVDTSMSRNLEEQAAFYTYHFNTDLNAAQHFFSTASRLKSFCEVNYLDLVFLIDTSSSIASGDVEEEKKFAIKMTDTLNIGSESVRVAFVTFSSGFKTHFKLNNYTTREEIKRAISTITYLSGATDTGAALKYVTENVFSLKHGSRVDVPKVVILVTDGRSTDNTATILAASKAKEKGILIFVIGVGEHTSDNEMKEMASSPNCTHVKSLQGYVDLDSIVDELQANLCKAPVVVNNGSHRFHCQGSQLFRIPPSSGKTTATIKLTQGTLNIFGSFFTSTPNQVFCDFMTTATGKTGAVILVINETRQLYLNISTAVVGGCTDQFIIEVNNIDNIIRQDVLLTCLEGGIKGNCSIVDVLNYIHTVMQSSLLFVNPCAHRHPNSQLHRSTSDFLYCVVNDTVLSFQCPTQTVYESNNYICIPGEPPNTTTISSSSPAAATSHKQTTRALNGTISFVITTTPGTIKSSSSAATTAAAAAAHKQKPLALTGTTSLVIYGSPCTKDNVINADRFFHAYPDDPMKYVVCTNVPLYGIVKTCPPPMSWNETALTCMIVDQVSVPVVDPTKEVIALLENICRRQPNSPASMFFPHPTDPHKYVQCGQFGNAYVKTCPQHKFWVQSILTCIPHGIYLDGTFLFGKR